ncbi:DUF2946 domain-containing protein [Leclercia adecarboxylata]|uniref:DUF2946 domain-containing protein n=1 Tax=Leclercia adecarboxylata TaxID=83655 RepID=UPI002DC7F31B|nr:DUF2946 domain-containing protein [Leclercia adecarboxylata]
MLFVAPVISKSLVHQPACPPSVTTITMSDHHGMAMSDMHHNMAMAEPCEQNFTLVHRLMAGSAMSPMEEIACGYCQLLIHLPFVPLVLTGLLWLVILCARIPLSLPAILSPVFRAWAPQRARAPPAASVNEPGDSAGVISV